MELIEVYIQEVTRRLPEKNRKDIAMELRSTIEDMLPDDYSEKDVKEALQKLGNPAALASAYRDQPMHLIGPRYYDVYISLLKMIIPIASVVLLISTIAESFISYREDEAILNIILITLGEAIWGIFMIGIQVFFWLTIVFAVLERNDKGKDQQPLTAGLQKWSPDELKSIRYVPKKKEITKLEIFGGLIWTGIWVMLYFYANQLIGVYEGGVERMDFVMPVFNQETLLHYWPLVLLLIIMEVGLALYKLLKGQWTQKVAVFNMAHELAVTIGFIVIISNPDVMTAEFFVYMGSLFETNASVFEGWIIGGTIAIVILSAAYNVFDGFRKARIR